MLNLALELRTVIIQYEKSLYERCPLPSATRAGKAPVYVVSVAEELELCKILNTSEYCAEVCIHTLQYVQ